ncbi:helix-turn-helix domain-containing protein [Chelativorans xinjiangense]|uniref:helix-turn-helix domain-containing protein n=1 Tax=Chelativorans xinjiangense TaxID=2681485 RepID=UPI001357C7DB|nr:helix-turn-helix domain-containing protein [Chelativorans xinjiangense]
MTLTDKKTRAQRFREIRERLGISQEAYADALGVPGGRQRIYKLEVGRADIPEPVFRLALMMGQHGLPNQIH